MNAKSAPKKLKVVSFTLGSQRIGIPVPPEIKAYFNEQIGKNTPVQKRRRTTVMHLKREAYKAGLEAGQKSN
jgi:hypothetical protein